MAISEYATNSATISTTEYSLPNASTTLTPKTDDGIFQLYLDTTNMALGDEYLLRFYEKCRSGDTSSLIVMHATLQNGQADPLYISESFILMHGWDITLTKIAGTDRSFGWSIRQVA